MRHVLLASAFVCGLIAIGYGTEKPSTAADTHKPQVKIHVQIMEVSRTKLREQEGFGALGKNVSVVAAMIEKDGPEPAASKSPAEGSGMARFHMLPPDHKFFATLKALQERQLVKVLAEPWMVTTSGRACSIHMGGEIPVPASPQAEVAKKGDDAATKRQEGAAASPSPGNAAVDFQRYGTFVDALPQIERDGRMHIDIHVRNSTLDAAHLMSGNGVSLPVVKTFEMETGVEFKKDRSLVIGGLIEQHTVTSMMRPSTVPLALMAALGFPLIQDSVVEVEMLVVVTPEVVNGAESHKVAAESPKAVSRAPAQAVKLH